MINTLKKRGFTDKFGVWASILSGLFLFFCLAIFTFTDKDPIAYVVSIVGFLTTLIGFIINKNKNENIAKITSSSTDEPTASQIDTVEK